MRADHARTAGANVHAGAAALIERSDWRGVGRYSGG